MASVGIWTIRVLRCLPHSRAFDEHLTRCAFAEIFFDEHLTIAKVLGLSRCDRTEGAQRFESSALQDGNGTIH